MNSTIHCPEGHITYAQVLEQAQRKLKQRQIPDADLDARFLLEYVMNWNTASYFLHSQEEMKPEQYQIFWNLIEKRARHIPLQHLTGEQEFMGLVFRVSDAVLIPRQDTETLVELALQETKGKRVLDVCTGSGCIAISLQQLGEPAVCHGIDLSEDALEIARANADRLQAEVTFWKSDLFDTVAEQYDVIVSNPPYIPPSVLDNLMPEVREYEPRMALDGGIDGLDFYRKLAKESGKHLIAGGQIFMEIGHDQGEAVVALFQSTGYDRVKAYKDLSGRDRVVHAVWNG